MKEPICDTWRGGSKIQQELMAEKWSQGTPVSAGNGRKGEGEKKAKGYRQKNTGKFQTDVFKKQSEDHAQGKKPCNLSGIFASLVRTQKQTQTD